MMRGLLILTAILLGGCSVMTAAKEASEAAHFSRAALEETKQLAGRVGALEENSARAQTSALVNQRKITEGLREVAKILGGLSARLEMTACLYPAPIDEPATRVP